MPRGFVAVSTAIIVTLTTAVLAGGTFGAYKYNEAVKERDALQQEIIEQKEREIKALEKSQTNEEASQTVEATASSTNQVAQASSSAETSTPKEKSEPVENVRTVVEYVPVEVPVEEDPVENPTEVSTEETEPIATEESAEESDTDSRKQEEDTSTEQATDAFFDIIAVRQTAFPDEHGGVYGGYEIAIAVTAPDDSDVYIPQTTTNTIDAATIGFTYSVLGDGFQGVEDSEVSCSLRRDNHCRIKAGRSKEITTTVWLFPNRDSNGNYGLSFNSIYYQIHDEWRTHEINRSTAKINLMY